MGFPDYFERNAQAAGTLIRGFQPEALTKRLENEAIGLMIDAAGAVSLEGRATADLLVRLSSRIYPTLAIVGSKGAEEFAESLRALAVAINPKITILDSPEDCTRIVVVGNSAPRHARSSNSVWYVGSENWLMRLSRSGPVHSGSSANPLAAGAAACVAMANVFRAIFASELEGGKLDEQIDFSVLDMRPTQPRSVNPAMPKLTWSDLHLVGAGAIGNGFLWAISRLDWSGTLLIVDPEAITDSNLQRYVMCIADDRGKQKAQLASTWVAQASDRSIVPRPTDWGAHIYSQPGHRADLVVSALDTKMARIQVQAALPKRIINGWTQDGEAGVSRHELDGDKACLACLYLPEAQSTNEDAVIARALSLPEDIDTLKNIRRRLQQRLPTDAAFLQMVATATGIPADKLKAFENRPLREFYTKAVCGGAVIEFHSAARAVRADVPMAFQSALSGILLAAELARPQPTQHMITQIDLLNAFPSQPGRNQVKTVSPACMCSDEDFLIRYRSKYSA